MDKSYRKAADGVSRNTGQQVSAQKAWDIVQQYGEKIEQQEIRLRELANSEKSGQLVNIHPCSPA